MVRDEKFTFYIGLSRFNRNLCRMCHCRGGVMAIDRENLALKIAYRMYVRDRKINDRFGRYSYYGDSPGDPVQTFKQYKEDVQRHRKCINDARIYARLAIEEYEGIEE